MLLIKLFLVFYEIISLQVLLRVCVLSVWPKSFTQQYLGSYNGLHPVHWSSDHPNLLCYGRIAWILTKRIDSNLEATSSTSEVEDAIKRKFLKARNNTIKTVLLVGICFIICWVNDEVYYLMYNLGYDADWNGTYFKFCVAMIYLNCTVNPIVYLASYQDYHRALREFFSRSKGRTARRDVENASSTSTSTYLN